jgi:hypothetical protein
MGFNKTYSVRITPFLVVKVNLFFVIIRFLLIMASAGMPANRALSIADKIK